MRILHVKVSTILNEKDADKLRRKIINDLNAGLVISDNSTEIEVLEVDYDDSIKLEDEHFSDDEDLPTRLEISG